MVTHNLSISFSDPREDTGISTLFGIDPFIHLVCLNRKGLTVYPIVSKTDFSPQQVRQLC